MKWNLHKRTRKQCLGLIIRGAGVEWLVGGLILCFNLHLTAQETGSEVKTELVRVGISSAFYVDVNENDAKAALKAWVATISTEKGVPMDSQARTVASREIVKTLQDQAIDVISMSVPDYWKSREYVEQEPVFIADEAGSIFQEFLVLAHQDSGIQDARSLQGRSLLVFQNNRMQMAFPWLDVLLAEQGCGRVTNWCGQVTYNGKLFGAVLPVYFRKVDACLVTRKGFETMKELNPQLGKALKIVAASPKMVTGGVWFRRGYESIHKEKLIAGLQSLHTTPAGQQALTIFQADRITKQSSTCLDGALALLDAHRRLFEPTNSTSTDPGKTTPNMTKEQTE